jgi:hypothetical protein
MLFIWFFWNCKYIHRLMIARRLPSWWTNRKGQLGSQNKHKTRNSNRNKSKALQTKQMLSEKKSQIQKLQHSHIEDTTRTTNQFASHTSHLKQNRLMTKTRTADNYWMKPEPQSQQDNRKNLISQNNLPGSKTIGYLWIWNII